ncbi:MAG: hypothetical protein K0U41_07065 [Gammaproteobacteria bacterium]|nr:hypothetical protein [Gammaproteobacteria bacterium]
MTVERILGAGQLRWSDNPKSEATEEYYNVNVQKTFEGRASWLADFNTELDADRKVGAGVNHMFIRTTEQIIQLRAKKLYQEEDVNCPKFKEMRLDGVDEHYFDLLKIRWSSRKEGNYRYYFPMLFLICDRSTDAVRIWCWPANPAGVICVDIKSNQLTTRIYL